jgi:acetylornithine deacetylase/succinyl-diaminopimelate desuccinylase-like protein
MNTFLRRDIERELLVMVRLLTSLHIHPTLHSAAAAYRKAFGRIPAFSRMGGSLPVVSMFQSELAIPTVLMGFALPDDRVHAPNEKFHLPNFYKGIETSIWFLWEISRQFRHKKQAPALYAQAVKPMDAGRL